jgi:hypothetical protein
MKEPNSQRGTSAVVTISPHMQRRQPTPPRSSLYGERRTVLARPSAQAEECAKDHRRYEKWSADREPRRDPVA